MAKLSAVYRSMASLHRAGVGWTEAIESAAAGESSFAEARRRLARGTSLAESLAGVVDPLDEALLEAGERNGTLEQTLERMADEHDERAHRKREAGIRQLYPLVLAHVTAVLMAVPDLIQGHPGAAVRWMLLVLVPTWTWMFVRARAARRDRPLAGGRPPEPPPAVGEWRNRRDDADARALEALGSLYEAGVPLAAATRLAARAGWGGRAAVDLHEGAARVDAGEELSGAFSRLPPDLVGRIRSAEASGSLGPALLRIADELRGAADARRRRVAQVVPLAMILFLGALVFLRLVAFYGDYLGRVLRLAGP